MEFREGSRFELNWWVPEMSWNHFWERLQMRVYAWNWLVMFPNFAVKAKTRGSWLMPQFGEDKKNDQPFKTIFLCLMLCLPWYSGLLVMLICSSRMCGSLWFNAGENVHHWLWFLVLKKPTDAETCSRTSLIPNFICISDVSCRTKSETLNMSS